MSFPSFASGEVLTAADMNAVGLWKVGSFTASAQTTLTCDNVFTSDYDNYKIVVKMGGTSNTNILFFEFINTNGAIVNASYFSASYSRDFATGGATGVTVINSGARVNIGYMPNGTGNPLGAECTVYGPRLNSEWTTVTGQYTGISSGVAYQGGEFYATCNPSPQTMRGFRVGNSAGTNMTGSVRVYGWKN